MRRMLRTNIYIALTLAVFTLPLAAREGEKPDDKPKWDVNNASGPSKDVPIDVDEGTWMNVDLSPDGSTITFDLLGDIYTLPITGGEATALTHDVAWQMQPCFSPDGKRIAFTSDQGGGDNIWVMDRDGKNAKQVTKESFRLLNDPRWSPDGQYIAAHKHFTSRRSLGAGEIWMYHVATGGDGLQLTTRRNEQKDLGEPAFSPDGRYLYFSYDSTAGDTFEYNKNSNTQIYAIDRLDLASGERIPFVTGPGGACRPTPSHDGNQLAFVRRVRFQTSLFVMDTRSGRATLVYSELERDMQETWAIHGVYPRMAWSPDDSEIVLYAGGKIRRVNVAAKRSTPIPFHVKTTRRVQDAVRYPVAVAPDTFDVKALRDVRVSPRGDRVAYQALGHIWVRALPDGTPQRLTNDETHFEFMPSFSRDGSSIVYVSWSDADLASVRVTNVTTGDTRSLTREMGHYFEPVVSPDGKTVVYRKGSGGYLVSPLWSSDKGIYKVPFTGGESVLVTKDGSNPQFGADSDRVYLYSETSEKETDKHILSSIGIDGREPRTHLTSENATEFALSPDGRWVAFQERFNAYIAPFVPTGRELAIGPKSKALPIARASRDAGENLQFSGDSSALHWSLGPELFERKLTDAFAFLDGAPEKLPEVPATGRNISFQAQQSKPDRTLALVGARIVTMKGDEVIEDGVIVIEKNRIKSVGRRAKVALPSGARIVDVSGTTITPGIVDVHAHGSQSANGITPQTNWIHCANLAYGVTTIHDPSNDTNSIFAVSELAKTGAILSPRTYSTGTILYGAAGSFKAEIDSLDDALSHLRRLKAIGAFSVKSYNQPRREQRQMVIEAARQLNMMVVPEGGSLLQHNLTMVVDGHTGVEHSLPVERVFKDITQLWGATQTGYTPTLVVGYGGLDGEHYWYQHMDAWREARLNAFVPRFVLDPRSRRREMAPDEDYNILRSAGIVKSLVDAGARAQLGAHGQLAGLGAHWELWLLKQSGITNLQALRAATLDGARYVGLDADIGSIEPGKLADMIVMDKNPLEDIRNSDDIRFTVLNGRIYDAHTLAPADGGAGARPKLFFESMQEGMPLQASDAHCAGCGR
ncbi:MAG: PD40 domain-containing protein [Planctomycetes bacterium]|nr:PD40 domain-containing protein [Planctomycetota bacterium]